MSNYQTSQTSHFKAIMGLHLNVSGEDFPIHSLQLPFGSYRILTFSDFHWDSAKLHKQELDLSAIQYYMKDVHICVLNGDMIDAKYTSESQELIENVELLKKFVIANSHCKFIYVVGNHEEHPVLLNMLRKVEVETEKRFTLCPNCFVINNRIIFTHGDCHYRNKDGLSSQQIFHPKRNLISKLLDF